MCQDIQTATSEVTSSSSTVLETNVIVADETPEADDECSLQSVQYDTCMQPTDFTDYCIAPSGGNKPVSFFF